MWCKHDLDIKTCRSCKKPTRPGYQPFERDPDRVATCSICETDMDDNLDAIWYLHRPAHKHCVMVSGSPTRDIVTDYGATP